MNSAVWLVLLTLMKNFSCDANNPFILEDKQLTPVEGSCVQMKCKPGRHVNDLVGAHWFWMKDAAWNDKKRDFDATIIFSSDESKRPVDPLFRNRVRYIDSPPSTWNTSSSKPEKLCNILICDLKKSDRGNYSFRFTGVKRRWATEPATSLTVVDNPCPVTFTGPDVVKENELVMLRCSTLSSCPSNLQIQTSRKQPSTQLSDSLRTNTESPTNITRSFNVSWKDDGIDFSCQTTNNKDQYLIRKISLTVEYSPKQLMAWKIPYYTKEGDSVTLACSAKGQPPVTFKWFKNDQKLISGAELKFTSVQASDSGSYFCEAVNKVGMEKYGAVNIDVSDVSYGVPHLTTNRTMNIVKLLFMCGFILFTIIPLLFVFRCWRNKSVQDRNGWWTGARRENISEAGLTESPGTRDILLPDRASRPIVHRLQPHPNVTSASNITTVCSTVDLGKRYQSEPDIPLIYENLRADRAAKPPNPRDSDSDTGEKEVTLNVGQVKFKPWSGRRDSSSSEDEARYS